MSDEVRIDRARVLHVAKLAALSLSDAEADALAGDLAKIVAHVEELGALDTSDVPPTASVHAPRGDGWRADEMREGLSHDDALAAAPRADHDGFAVPTFVES